MSTKHLLLAYAMGALTVAILWALLPRRVDAPTRVAVQQQPARDPQCYATGTAGDASVKLELMTCVHRDGRIVEAAIK